MRNARCSRPWNIAYLVLFSWEPNVIYLRFNKEVLVGLFTVITMSSFHHPSLIQGSQTPATIESSRRFLRHIPTYVVYACLSMYANICIFEYIVYMCLFIFICVCPTVSLCISLVYKCIEHIVSTYTYIYIYIYKCGPFQICCIYTLSK